MNSVQPEIQLMEPVELKQAADKYALGEYMKKQSREKYGPSTENLILHRLIKIVRTEVDRLPAFKRDLIYQRFWEDLTDLEISKRMRCHLTRVQDTLTRTLEHLGERIMAVFMEQCRIPTQEALCCVHA